jgi:hypothetical protein
MEVSSRGLIYGAITTVYGGGGPRKSLEYLVFGPSFKHGTSRIRIKGANQSAAMLGDEL